MKKVLFFVSLFVTASLYAGQVTVSRDVSSLASEYGWEQGSGNNCYLNFQLDENISIISASGNAKYLKETTKESLRYYQGSSKGQFTIRAKSGVMIQSVKFTYGVVKTGVITANYGTDGKSIAEANQRLSGIVYSVDANTLTFYTGTTGTNTDGQVRITNFEVKYIVEGTSITKSAKDLKYQYGYKDGDCPQSVAVNNVISMNVNNSGTQKYLDNGNQFRYYQGSGPLTIKAREGAMIHFVKINYTNINNGVFNTEAAMGSVPENKQILSDSILYIDANSITLYVGRTDAGTGGQVRISKITVNYTDSNAIIENFSQCPVEKSDTTVNVVGVDGIYNWQLNGFSREMSHHLYYEQTTQLYIGRKMVADNEEGGMKEVSFEWFASNSAKNAKFAVKAGTETLASIDSAATGGWYPVTYTKKGIKSNGALAIEVDAASGSQVEINHVSIIPYLRFVMREDSVDAASVSSYDVREMLIDNTDDAANIVYSIESDATQGAAISNGVVDLSGSQFDGAVVVKAAWESVTAHFTLNVKVAGTPTGIDNDNDNLNHNLRKVVVNGEVRIYRNGAYLNLLGQPVAY